MATRHVTSSRNLLKLVVMFVVLVVGDLILLIAWTNVSIEGENGQETLSRVAEIIPTKSISNMNQIIRRGLNMGNNVEKVNIALRDWKKIAQSKQTSLSYPGVDEKIADILRAAYAEVDSEAASQLPTWENVTSQYGDVPIIHGLETCETYRKRVKPQDRMIGPVGIFNTGTNLLFQLMKENCDIKEARYSNTHKEPKQNGIRYQAPWGKHNPVSSHRFKNAAAAWGIGIKQENFMPIVLIKDPYHWMGSECRHNYLIYWDHSHDNCPNLIQKQTLDIDVPISVTVKYALNYQRYDSLVDVWNKWYREYEEQSFPMLQTRFEDLVFHGEEVLRTACDCVGGVFTDSFVYMERNAKEDLPIHVGANGLVETMIQVGNPKNRLLGLTDRDRLYASNVLDHNLMDKFGYIAPPLPDT